MAGEKKYNVTAILPPLKKGEPFNKEGLIEELDRLTAVYNNLKLKNTVEAFNAPAMLNQRREMVREMWNLAAKTDFPAGQAWLKPQMVELGIPIPSAEQS